MRTFGLRLSEKGVFMHLVCRHGLVCRVCVVCAESVCACAIRVCICVRVHACVPEGRPEFVWQATFGWLTRLEFAQTSLACVCVCVCVRAW